MPLFVRTALILGVIIAPYSAQAATIVQSGQGLVAINQFNPTLGTLNSVTVASSFGYRIGFTSSTSQRIHLLGSFGFSEEGVVPVNQISSSWTIDPQHQMVQISNGIQSIFTTDLSYYIGTGVKFIGNSFTIGATYADIAGEPAVQSTYFFAGSPLGGGTVTYDYTPRVVVPVPEPSTWLMMVAGIGMIGYALRKRRAAVLLTKLA